MTYIKRPLQAAVLMNSAAHKCQLFLRYKPNSATHAAYESARRVFWSCYIIESDTAVELNDIPQSGCAQMQHLVLLPGEFHSHSDAEQERLSSLYFLSCIAVRRLLNRVHSLIYPEEKTNDEIDLKLILELDHQLEEWRDLLPADMRFDVADDAKLDKYQAFLRQRYFACKTVINRPFFNYVMVNDMKSINFTDQIVIDFAKNCLDACYQHMRHVTSYPHTVFIDSWICSLSMVAGMLVIYMAHRSKTLLGYVRNKYNLDQIRGVAIRVEGLIDQWINNSKEEPPTLKQCNYIISLLRKSLS